MRQGEGGTEREEDWIDDGVQGWCVCVGKWGCEGAVWVLFRHFACVSRWKLSSGH